MGEAPPLASARSRLGRLPEVMSDEDGDTYFAIGHVDRYAFTVSLMLTFAEDESAEDAFRNIVGFTQRGRWRDAAEDFIAKVRHGWWRERPDINDEAMERCGPDDEGAQAFTEVTIR